MCCNNLQEMDMHLCFIQQSLWNGIFIKICVNFLLLLPFYFAIICCCFCHYLHEAVIIIIIININTFIITFIITNLHVFYFSTCCYHYFVHLHVEFLYCSWCCCSCCTMHLYSCTCFSVNFLLTQCFVSFWRTLKQLNKPYGLL